jgi:predicted regulator of Ras-like GTPase activity (Roadblock/LC7/MglB family)
MFREVLKNILNRTEGCKGVLIMGFDGIAVEKVWQEDAGDRNYDIVVAEYTSLIRSAKQKNDDTGVGKLNEVTVSNENDLFIMRLISDEYFLAMILSTEGNFGRGRYELRRAELLLENEFVI